ncbi:MAG: MMPL family transporter, partial [Thermoprotei archaeon]
AALVNSSVSSTISSNFSMTPSQFFGQVAKLGINPGESKILNLTLFLVSKAIYQDHPQAASQIESHLNISLTRFLSLSYSLGKPVEQNGLRNLTLGLVLSSAERSLAQQPFLTYNGTALRAMAAAIYDTNSSAGVARSLISTDGLSGLPVSPTPPLLRQLVDGSGNMTLVTLQFDAPLADAQIQQFVSLAKSFNSTSFKVYYTADQILNKDLQSIVTESEKYALPFGIGAAIAVVGLFFLSPLAALIPTLMFGASMLVGFGLTDLIVGDLEHQTLSFISPIIISLLALGLATDYVVLMLNRYRQEHATQDPHPVAVTVKWAGEAVFTSGLTVVISYIVLSAAHIPLFSDVGTVNVIVVSTIIACSLSLLPALLVAFGPRMLWPSADRTRRRSPLSFATRKAVSRPKTVVGIILALTLISIYVAVSLPVNVNFLGLTPNSPAKEGLNQITQNFGGSTLTPTYVVVVLPKPLSSGGDLFNMSELSELWNITKQVWSSGGVQYVYGPLTPYNSSIKFGQINSLPAVERQAYFNSMSRFISRSNTSVYLEVVYKGDPYSNAVLKKASSLQTYLTQGLAKDYEVLVGGASVDSYNIIQYVYSVLPKIIEVLVGAIFVVLLLQIRSVFTPARLIGTILSAVTWSLAMTWLIYVRGSGASIFVFAPLFLVTTMLGVGMDYDIFLIVRVREEASKGYDDVTAILNTAETTAGVVAALGLILSAVFLALVLTRIELLQQIGVTLALGVLMDTFIVWLLYVPSVMTLARRLNWWPSDPRRQ